VSGQISKEKTTAMKPALRLLFLAFSVSVSLILAACSGLQVSGTGGSGGGGGGSSGSTYTIGGTVTNLLGTGLVLQDALPSSVTDTLAVTGTGQTVDFTFTKKTTGSYAVTVSTQPSNPAQTCTVTANGSGTATANVTNVQVTCSVPAGTLSIGGTVSGLAGTGLVLQDNGGDNLPISANGSFTFATLLPMNSQYKVTVYAQPTAQTCTVTNGSGTATANVTNVQVNCSGGTVSIAGTVTDLLGTGLVLQDVINGNAANPDKLPILASGNFTFSTAVPVGGTYNVTVLTQPATPTQTCVVANGQGTASANVTNISVSCGPIFTVGGTVTGLVGSGLVLLDNGTDNLPITKNGSFTFATPLANGENFAVTVLTQPTSPAQTCTVANGSGTVNGNVTNVQVACSQVKYSISGVVVGLITGTGDTVELMDNAGDDIFVTGDTSFTFPTQITSGTIYNVSIFEQPTSQPQGCVAFNYTGVATGDVTDVIVDCQHNDWAWMFGSSVENSFGTATLPPSEAADPNTPGGRDFAVTWTDASGQLWLFGGVGWPVTVTPPPLSPGLMNDLWVWTGWPYGNQAGHWIPADLPIIPPTGGGTPYADTTSLQYEDGWPAYGTQGSGTSCATTPLCTRPGARWGGASWTDASGNLWMFGGQGIASNGYGLLNDMWEFQPGQYDLQISGTTVTGTGTYKGQWVWRGGADIANTASTTTFPGARWAPATWTDASSNLWMFGGQGYDSNGNLGLLNDLWKYTASSGTWTLVSGSTTASHNGVYGTQGTGAGGNAPGGRQAAVLWMDSAGNVWLFGGFGLDSVGTGSTPPSQGATLNDLWEYNVTTGLWTWVSGSNIANQSGVYGTQTVEAATSVPGARWGAVGWTDLSGDPMLFGGWGYGSNLTLGTGFLNDIWEYDLSKGQWIWWKGSTDVDQSGVYFPQIMTANYVNNIVGARRGAARWLPLNPLFNDYMWMFGGEGYDASTGNGPGLLSDLWRYLPYP
jgi:hypothetical protein